VKTVFIKDLQERDEIDSIFLVQQKTTAMAKNGKPYLTLRLMDRSGEVEGRVWDRVEELERQFDRNDFIRVSGRANVYMGKMQLIIQELQRLDETQVDLADFLPVCPRPAAEMEQELRQRVAEMTDPHLQALLQAFLDDPALLPRFLQAPAAKAMHHVYLGGLLEHSLSVAALAVDICRHYPGLNRDLLVAGALLHDIGKIRELDYVRSFGYTDEGKLVGHIVIGAQMVEEKMTRIPDFPPLLRTLVTHLMLSHHGQYDYGSPKRPKTLEAVILNYLDDLDSKINGVRTHIDREGDQDGDWTSYHRQYDRYFFRGTPPGGEADEPLEATAPTPAEVRPSRDKEAPRKREEQSGRRFGYTLAEQLQGKTFDLFNPSDKE